jgi:4-amino-4-deoxy-L-arabinose transferase-like glycosyltransferase
MLQRLNHRLGHYALLLATSASLFLINLGGPALWDLDEGRNAAATLEMRESGDWIRPTFNGKLRSHKPALLYWLQAAAFEAFGVNEFAARLPSALAAMMTVLLVYELGRRMFDASTALLGGLMLASSALFCVSAHFANPDALLLTFTTATLLFFWLSIASGNRRWLLLAGPAAGLAMLAKGPVGVVPPFAAVVLYLLWTRNWNLLFNRIWISVWFLFGLVGLPWYVLVALETKSQFIAEFFLTHNLDRALSAMEDHTGPAWYYLVVVALGLGPWSVFLGSSAWCGLQSAARADNTFRVNHSLHDESTTTTAYRLLWCWIAVYLAVFTVAATKLPSYILPVLPPFALLIGRFLDRWRRGILELPAWTQPISLAILALSGVVMSAVLLIVGGAIPMGLPHDRIWPGVEQWWALGIVPVAGAVLGAWCLHRQWRTSFVAVLLIAAVGLLAPAGAGGSEALDRFRATRPLVEQVGALDRGREIRVGCFNLEFLPSLNFYVQRNVTHHQSDQDALDFLRQPLPVWLFLPRTDWEQLAPRVATPYRVLGSHREMYRAGEVVVVTNH